MNGIVTALLVDMKTMQMKAGSKVTTFSGKVYTATGRVFECGGADYIDVEPTVDNDFMRSIEVRSIATVQS